MAQVLVTGADGKPTWVEVGAATPTTGVILPGGTAAVPAAPTTLVAKVTGAVKGAVDSLRAMFPNAGPTLLSTLAAKSGAKLTAAQAELEKMKLLQQQQAQRPGGGTNWMMYGGIALGVVAAVFIGSKLLKGKR